MGGALAGLVILVIGDSHIASLGHFNNLLHEGLVAQGATVNTFGVCSSLPDDWITPNQIVCGRGERHNTGPAQLGSNNTLRGWSLPALIADYKPNLVVVEMGDTLAGYGAAPELPRDFIARQVGDLLQPIKADKVGCIWIGPPWGTEGGAYKKTLARVKALSDYLAQIVGHISLRAAHSQPIRRRMLVPQVFPINVQLAQSDIQLLLLAAKGLHVLIAGSAMDLGRQAREDLRVHCQDRDHADGFLQLRDARTHQLVVTDQAR